MSKRTKGYALRTAGLLIIALFVVQMVAFASEVDVAVVDATAPTGSVTIAPGGSAPITINMSVTGNQNNVATFQVYRDWNLSGGTFTGSNPQTFEVAARSGGAPATTFSTTGTVSVAAGQVDGTFALAVGAINISTSAPGALTARNSSNYQVTVETPIVLPPADTTAPTIDCTVPDQSIWYANNVSVPCDASDASGLADSDDASFSLTTNVAQGAETANASTDSRQVCDAASPPNCATAGPYEFMVDRKAPTNVQFVGGPSNGATYVWGSVPAAPTCTADDGGSKLDDCVVTGYSNQVGSHTLTSTATDNVGNSSTAQIGYNVVALVEFTGFHKPVEAGATNSVKAGSTVPLKFNVFINGVEVTDTSAVSYTAKKMSCSGIADPDDDGLISETGNTSLRYSDGQFIQNWSTKGLAKNNCYVVTVKAAMDGGSATISAYFQMK